MESIIGAVIAGVLSLVGVVITTMAQGKKMEQQLAISQAVTDTKIEELTREVREHNNFARRMPVVEAQIDALEKRVDRIGT